MPFKLGGPTVYNWGVGSPDATLIPADKWSVSATGLINIPRSAGGSELCIGGPKPWSEFHYFPTAPR
jgi:hypothetical protein